jgi:hypothetical protein
MTPDPEMDAHCIVRLLQKTFFFHFIEISCAFDSIDFESSLPSPVDAKLIQINTLRQQVYF